MRIEDMWVVRKEGMCCACRRYVLYVNVIVRVVLYMCCVWGDSKKKKNVSTMYVAAVLGVQRREREIVKVKVMKRNMVNGKERARARKRRTPPRKKLAHPTTHPELQNTSDISDIRHPPNIRTSMEPTNFSHGCIKHKKHKERTNERMIT